MHTQRGHARSLHRHGATSVFIVKRNKPRHHLQLAKLPWADVPTADHTQDKVHGRREARTLQIVQIAAGIDFPDAKLAARLIRTRTDVATGKADTETV